MGQLDEGHPVADRAGRRSPTEAFMAVESAEDCSALLRESTTPAEFEAPVDRWGSCSFQTPDTRTAGSTTAPA